MPDSLSALDLLYRPLLLCRGTRQGKAVAALRAMAAGRRGREVGDFARAGVSVCGGHREAACCSIVVFFSLRFWFRVWTLARWDVRWTEVNGEGRQDGVGGNEEVRREERSA